MEREGSLALNKTKTLVAMNTTLPFFAAGEGLWIFTDQGN